MFKKNPAKYLPTYEGWCAYAMLSGKEVDINPKAYHIQKGQIHFFLKLIGSIPWPNGLKINELIRQRQIKSELKK